MATDPVRTAFERTAANLLASPPPALRIEVVDDARLAVPGFTTLEAFLGGGGRSLRGWARADGTAVLARLVKFGPVLEALGFADDDATAPARAIAERLAWAHGPGFVLIDELAKGELGADRTYHVAPERDSHDDGRVEFRFALRTEEPSVIQYRVFRETDATYTIDVHQLAPR
jgi:hypothetical protein